MKPRCLCFNSSQKCSNPRTSVVACGFYRRKSDGAKIQRYKCQACKKSFSDASFSFCFKQKKRQLNSTIFRLLVGGFSQRRTALELNINRKTVVRKFILMGQLANFILPSLYKNAEKIKIIEFDDLETFEHSKCKPLSASLAVECSSRRILGFRVSQMPAKGTLAALSRKKYGPRKDERKPARRSLMQELSKIAVSDVVIKSDENPHYGPDVKRYFPNSKHLTFKGRRGCVVGQGELKRGGFDPLFSLNHTCAMLRANINRLFRRTWCTTKRAERLKYHIAIYSLYHNLVLLKN